MLNSIFRKQLVLYIGILLITFALVGAALPFVLWRHFSQSKIQMLYESGAKMSRDIVQYYPFINMLQVSNQASNLRQYLNASIVITNADRQIIACSNDIILGDNQHIVISELDPLYNGSVVILQGKLGGLYTETQLTVGYPVIRNAVVVGAIIFNSPLSELNQTFWGVYRVTGLCLFAVAVFGFILIYFSSRRMSKPLRQMSEAARIIADGDFEKRIAVTSKDEVGQLAESFNNMAESLARQERIRRDFISNISHDFRSPLTSMRGFLHAMADGTIPESGRQHYIDIVLAETERLTKLANDILLLNQIQSESESLQPQNFDVNSMIVDILTGFEPQIDEKSINVDVDLLSAAIVNADPEKIRRVLLNLIDNAVKFTPAGGDLYISTGEASVKENAKLIIKIKNSGEGLSPEEKTRIFDRFYKADVSRGLHKQGSGLGLSIVKEFIRAHGESITVESELGQGCEFSFTLPKG